MATTIAMEDLRSTRSWAIKFHKRITLLGVIFASVVANNYVKIGAGYANSVRGSLDNTLFGTADLDRFIQIKTAGYTLSCLIQIGMAPIFILFILLLSKWQAVHLIKRNGLIRFPIQAVPDVHSLVSSIWEIHGLPRKRIPCLYWQPFNKDVNACLFGEPGNRAVAVTAGLVADYVGGDQHKAKAILSHEFAHIHNHDVTYFYLMQLFLLLSVLSFLLFELLVSLYALLSPGSFIYSQRWSSIFVRYFFDVPKIRLFVLFETLEKLLVLAILTLAMRYTIREREAYADAWAVDRGTPATDLEEILMGRDSATLNLPHSLTSGPLGLRRIWRALRFHPESCTRARMLKYPLDLINPRPAYSFVTGFLGALQLNQMDKFGLPQVIGVIGILCALWSLIIDSQAIAIFYRLSPRPVTSSRIMMKLFTHTLIFSSAFALGSIAEGITELFFLTDHIVDISYLLLLPLAFVAGVVLFFVFFSCVSVTAFAATLVLRERSKSKVINSFGFNWGIPVCVAACCIVFVSMLLAAHFRNMDSVRLDELFSSLVVLNVSPSTRTPPPPTVAFRPSPPTLLSEHQLTFGGYSDLHPRWSPDGKRIAFQSTRAGNYDIWAVAAEGGTPEQLTTSPLDEMVATWSPDGTRIAFLRFIETYEKGRGNIYVMNTDGSDHVQLTNDGSFKVYVAWTPDGRGLVYGGEGSTPDGSEMAAWMLDIETKERQKIVDYAAGSLSYNPDGTLLAFEAQNPELFRRKWLYVMDIQRRTVTPLITDLDRPWYPNWSPDGAWIAFHVGRKGSGGIWIVRPDGTDKTQLIAPPDSNRFPCWSPDGKRIAFNRDQGQDTHIWIAELDTE